jgi:hypothetical protein
MARDAKEYRKDAAKHIYSKYPDKIYAGKLPPMLKAVGVIDVLILRRAAGQRAQERVEADLEALRVSPAKLRTHDEVQLLHHVLPRLSLAQES